MDWNEIAERVREKNMREFEKHGGMSMYNYKFEADPTNVVEKYDYTGNIEGLEYQIKFLEQEQNNAINKFDIEKALKYLNEAVMLKDLINKIKITKAKEFLQITDEEVAEIKEKTQAKNDYELACELEKIILDMNKEVEDE